MYKAYLIGIDGSSLFREATEALERCHAVFGSERLRQLCDLTGKTVHGVTPLYEAISHIRETLAEGNVAVLASGDPLFFGIGRRLLDRLGSDQLEILPARSSMQLAAARFRVPWDDAASVSLHGRREVDWTGLLRNPKTFVLTDRENSPDAVAGKCLNVLDAAGRGDRLQWRIRVGERLGTADERIVQGDLVEIAGQRFDPLNIMLLEYSGDPSALPNANFGLQEDEIDHSRGLITKNEVRAATLHALRLPKTGVFWDIGAGSGSISLEAAVLCPGLQVFAVERRPEQLTHIRTNAARYLAGNIRVVEGEAPDVLASLPGPDRVFIGGSGGRLDEIIRFSCARLSPGGCLVVNGVLAGTRETAPKLMHEAGLAVAVSEIAVTRSRPFSDKEKTSLNPIAIMVGQK